MACRLIANRWGQQALVRLYRLSSVRMGARELARVVSASTAEIRRALAALSDVKSLAVHAVEINRLENEADTLLRVAVGKLFRTERDPLTVMKWKELYEGLEEATDRCEDVANLVEGIVLEQS